MFCCFPMTSAEVRQSFLDFFASKQHEIVPSASLLPTAPNLLFTNAGMNQFVPYFLGDRQAPYSRAADTQKCIRAGGKHNDLDDVGFDAYHQTFFEMLGNWSFGDYFKQEALTWSWELLTQVWGFPPERLYATVYKPGEGDPADFDQEAYDVWAGIFERAGLDPKKHIKYGGKKDNFWMMGDTGPCGPCSEIHMDLTADNQGELVNADSPWCIELWNDVFIQFNATETGDFVPLKAKHVDTGMGFERVAGIIATTQGFTDYSNPPSNYNADLFEPIFRKISELSGRTYDRTLPADPQHPTEAEMKDVVFRVLADHIRCLCCAIADGILPGNEGRNYVLRRILRRAVMYGRRLELQAGFFTALVEPVVQTLGSVFPELRERQDMIRKVIASEETAFDKTLDRGMAEFEKMTEGQSEVSGVQAFTLYDTYGFPLDLTQIIAEERGLKLDTAGFEVEMEKQRERARANQKKEIVRVSDESSAKATQFVGYDPLQWRQFETQVVDVVQNDDRTFLVFASTPFYAEMGGQIGDRGVALIDGHRVKIVDTQKDSGGTFLHEVELDGPTAEQAESWQGKAATLSLDLPYRLQIQRHHSATHILHWALRCVLGDHVHQAGSYVGPDRLRFDFAHFEAIQPEQLVEIERLCNEKILSNDSVRWYEIAFDEKPEDVVAFFGDKYGDRVRVVEIGGQVSVEASGNSFTLTERPQGGWSAELCGGTHVEATGEIGLLKVLSDSAVSAGTRRIEAVAGDAALKLVNDRWSLVDSLAKRFSSKIDEVPGRVDDLQERLHQAERELKQLRAKAAAGQAEELLSLAKPKGNLSVLAVVLEAGNPNELRELGAKIHRKMDNGLLVAGGVFGPKVTVCAFASDAAIQAGYKAGDIIRELTPKLGGKGGGKPDFAMGGGTEPGQLGGVLAEWQAAVVD
ncbi:MAG: alanyl-tRNA synthetase [Puniceicoccaceae bacterium 5H]|nr:MAG: alanyl-tRNA synthetase [Puniceicoccaceae bacterium 5H]